MSTGYSGTSLPTKLGIKASTRLLLLAAPEGFDETLGPLPADVTVRRRGAPASDVVVCFVTARADLERRIEALAAAVFPDGAVWVAWPKRASGVSTNMTEDVVRDVVLPLGLVDNKVCAIDATWSGLRVVHRLANRR